MDQKLVPAETEQRVPRKTQLIRAQLVDSAHRRQNITVRNVSATGIGGVAPDVLLKQGESVAILFRDDVMVQGTVAWVSGEKFGIQLREHLNLDVLTNLIRQKQAATVETSDWEVRRLHKVVTSRPGNGSIRRV